ncbi:hypothetical protein [Streptomyces sp. NPDC002324]
MPAGPADVDDRQAVEEILGRPLSRTRPTGALAPGSRGTVVRALDEDGRWRVEFAGTIDGPCRKAQIWGRHLRAGPEAAPAR